jgi:phosphatidylglycerol:prolipoprotein diacylglycerol transferase
VHPILFSVGSFDVHAYGALGALAFVVGAAIVLVRGGRAGSDANRLADLVFVGAVVALLGARGLYLLQHPGTFRSPLDLLDLRGGGLVFYGSLLAAVPVGTVAMRVLGLPVLATWDVVATALPLAHAISRVGCFLAGCCHGRATEVAWAVTYPADNPLTPAGPVHPVQLYEAAALVGIGVVVNALYERRRFDGQVIGTYVLLYAVARAALETFRGDDRGWFLVEALSFSQGVSALLATAALVLLVVLARRAAARRAIGASIRGPVV